MRIIKQLPYALRVGIPAAIVAAVLLTAWTSRDPARVVIVETPEASVAKAARNALQQAGIAYRAEREGDGPRAIHSVSVSEADDVAAASILVGNAVDQVRILATEELATFRAAQGALADADIPFTAYAAADAVPVRYTISVDARDRDGAAAAIGPDATEPAR